MPVLDSARRISVTEAHSLGVSGLVRSAATTGDRLRTLGDTPQAKQLHDVVAMLGRIGRAVDVPAEPAPAERLPAWLVAALTTTVGLAREDVEAMTHDQAMARLQAHWSTPPTSE